MSHIIRKPAFAYAKIKDADQATAQLISDFVFAIQSLYFSTCARLYSPVCVGYKLSETMKTGFLMTRVI